MCYSGILAECPDRIQNTDCYSEMSDLELCSETGMKTIYQTGALQPVCTVHPRVHQNMRGVHHTKGFIRLHHRLVTLNRYF